MEVMLFHYNKFLSEEFTWNSFMKEGFMEENIILDKLCLFGMTRQEATVYLCLYQCGELTGYEVAKQTGISRSNVYGALATLSDKGAAYLAEGNTSKYVAVLPEEFCENKIRQLHMEKKELLKNIPAVKIQEIGYLTITGYRNIKDKIINMIRQAQLRIYLSASCTLIQELEEELLAVIDKNHKLVLITDGMISNEVLKEKSRCYVGEEKGNSVRLIIDSTYALTGELGGKKEDTCLYTGQENFIQIFKDALRNEMRLIELTEGEKQK